MCVAHVCFCVATTYWDCLSQSRVSRTCHWAAIKWAPFFCAACSFTTSFGCLARMSWSLLPNHSMHLSNCMRDRSCVHGVCNVFDVCASRVCRLFPRDVFADEFQFSMLGLGDIVIPGVFCV